MASDAAAELRYDGMWIECECDPDSPREWKVSEKLQEWALSGPDAEVRLEWDGRAPRVRVVACSGRAYVRLGARMFVPLTAPGRVDVPVARLGALVVALDAAWTRCYRFRRGGGRGASPYFSVQEHVGRWLWRGLSSNTRVAARAWRAVRRWLDWSEEGLCAAAEHAVVAPASGAWSAFERLYLQLDRQAAPCSPYRHVSADLAWIGGLSSSIVDAAWPAALRPEARAARACVVDWLVGACPKLELGDAVLHRAVHLLDCVMQRDPVDLSDLQTLAGATLVLASKYEESDCITASSIDGGAFFGDCGQVARMEWRAARALGYRLGGGTARCWALHLAAISEKGAGGLAATREEGPHLTPLRRYLLDQALLDGAALALARPTLARQILRAERAPAPWLERLRIFEDTMVRLPRALLSKHSGCVDLRGAVPLQLA